MKKFLFLSFCLLFFMFFVGCSEEEDPGIIDENLPPVAEAGPDLVSSPGSTVTLDGSASTDPDEDPLTFSWIILTRPDNSTAALTNADAAVATFVPDVAGPYTLELTVSDGELSATDEVLLTVEEEVAEETVEVSSDINEDVVWEDIFENPDMPDYFVTRNIAVNAQLTIEPGVVVHVAQDAIITVESGGGSLIAEGVEDNNITFTSFDEAGEIHWGGLLFNSSSSQNKLDFVNIAFAGGGDGLIYLGGGVYAISMVGVNENARLNISNSNFTNSAGDGLFVLKSGSLPTFTNNTFSEISSFPMSLSVNQLGTLDNSNFFGDESSANNAVRIYDSVLEEDQEWIALDNNTAYLFQGDVRVDANLAIQEGALLQFNEGVVMQVSSTGVLTAKGSADNKVVFTSSDVDNGRKWGGLVFNSSSINNELDHVQVLHAGGDPELIYLGGGAYAFGNVLIGEDAKLKLTNSELSESDGNGLIIWGGELESFAGNSFYNNEGFPLFIQANMLGMIDEATDISGNANDVVAVYGSTFDGNARFADEDNPQWVNLMGDAQYLFLGNLGIEEDLVLAEGAQLSFAPDVVVTVNNGGSLNAVGTAENMIQLTAYEQDGNNNWGGLLINSDNSNNHFEHVEVSYGGSVEELLYVGGGVYLAGNIVVNSDGSLLIDNAQVTNSEAYGIAVNTGGDVTIGENMTYSNNELANELRQ